MTYQPSTVNEMCWLPTPDSGGTKILHLRTSSTQPWKPYTSFRFAVPDYQVPGGSKGWATYQLLKKAGWILLPSPQDSDLDDDNLQQRMIPSNC